MTQFHQLQNGNVNIIIKGFLGGVNSCLRKAALVRILPGGIRRPLNNNTFSSLVTGECPTILEDQTLEIMPAD